MSVLREAAPVNADLEAFVEPAGERERRAVTFAPWDRDAEGVGGRALAIVEELPLTPMMKVDPVHLGVLAANAADERRSRLVRNRGGGSGMVGSGPGREASDEKERA